MLELKEQEHIGKEPMASGNPNPSPATRWKKGFSPNPNGRKGKGIAKKDLKNFTQQELIISFNKVLFLNVEQLKESIKQGQTPAIEQIIARSLLRDYTRGKMANLEKILDRMIGKPKN